MNMAWYSYSQIASYRRCARRWRDGGTEAQNGAMVLGLAGHHTIERHLIPGLPDAPVNPAFVAEYAEGVVLAQSFIADYTFPERDAILDVEGSGIPLTHRIEAHGRPMIGVRLSLGIGLRGVSDLVYVADSGAVVIADWKSGHPDEEAHALQGAVYATLISSAWPGFERYIFQPVYLRSPRADYRLTYAANELPEVRAHVIGLILQMQSDRECEPKANRYCGTCPLRDRCPEYARAITEAPRQSLVQSLSMSQIEEEDRRVAGIAKLIAAYRAELAEEQERRVQSGPVIDGDTEWYLGSKLGNRSWEVGPVAAILVGLLNAGRISEMQFSACFKVVAGGLEKLKRIAPDEHAEILALAVRESSPEIRTRPVAPHQIIAVTEAAPSVADVAVEAFSSLPPSAEAPVGPEQDISGTSSTEEHR